MNYTNCIQCEGTGKEPSKETRNVVLMRSCETTERHQECKECEGSGQMCLDCYKSKFQCNCKPGSG